jgi:hypothetical protein
MTLKNFTMTLKNSMAEYFENLKKKFRRKFCNSGPEFRLLVIAKIFTNLENRYIKTRSLFQFSFIQDPCIN